MLDSLADCPCLAVEERTQFRLYVINAGVTKNILFTSFNCPRNRVPIVYVTCRVQIVSVKVL